MTQAWAAFGGSRFVFTMSFSIRRATLCRFSFLGNEIIAAGKELDKNTYFLSTKKVALSFWLDPLRLLVGR